MFEKEAKERARDYTENKERQIAYECGFLDGTDLLTKEKAKWEVKFNDSNRNWNELVTDWVKDLEREVTELKERIEKMKCCSNCDFLFLNGSCYYDKECKNKDHWKLMR